MRTTLLRSAFLLAAITCGSFAFAQTAKKDSTVSITRVPKFKPPVVQTFLGGYTDLTDSARPITSDEGKNIIGLYLRVTDKKGNKYTITHYGFAYTRVGVTEDEETGTVSPETDVVADDFTTTPLKAYWVAAVKESLHTGEQLHFYDIFVKDARGRLFTAPDLLFIIQ